MNEEGDIDSPLLRSNDVKGGDLGSILYLAVGIIAARFSWVVIKTTDTALLGHVSTHALEASSMADLYMSSTGVITYGYVLSVFVANARGANDSRMGCVWFAVSLSVLSILTAFVMGLWLVVSNVLSLVGVDEQMSHDAGYFSAVLSLCLPARSLFGQLSQLFSGNGVVYPTAAASAFAAVCNLVMGLILVLGIPFKKFDGFGFDACPWVTVFAEYSQLLFFIFVFILFKKAHLEFWVPVKLSDITRSRVFEYLKLYVPAALSAASDWWRVSLIGIFCAKLGDTELAVFNSSYRILWITLTVVGALAQSVGILVGQNMASGDIHRSKSILHNGGSFTILTLLLLTVIIFLNLEEFAGIFSNDTEIKEVFLKIRTPLCLELFLMNMSVFFEGILISLGKTRTVFWIGALGSWAGQVPACWIGTFYFKDLKMVFWGVSIGYGLTVFAMVWALARMNWNDLATEARSRAVCD